MGRGPQSVQSVPNSHQTPDAPSPPSWQIASPALTQVSRHFEGGGEDRGGGSGTSAAFASTATMLVPATTLALANGVQMHASHARSSEEADIGRFSSGEAPKGDSERSTRCCWTRWLRGRSCAVVGEVLGGFQKKKH